MFAVAVTIVVQPDCYDKFLPLLLANAASSKALEPGCRQFDVCVGNDQSIFLYETYDSADAFQLHLQSDHYKTFDQATQAMIDRKTVCQFHQVIQ
ncbi:MAG: putative quinol monooxygenase [Pseudomonadota bacterium]